ncbi:MAG: YdcF family protein [Betaproteobacteria bacterium]|nr:YdcF family protein [Betaproteobacteria bacterium]
MSGSWLVTNAVAAFLLPPLSLLMLALLGAFLASRWRVAGRALIGLAAFLLVGLSTQAGSRLLVAPLENTSLPLVDPLKSGAEAIVVVGGGRLYNAPEDAGRDQPASATLIRLRHAARLHRLLGLPVLVSGGAPDTVGESEAALMARVMRDDFGVSVRWLEQTSDNTAENAKHAAQQLSQVGIKRILLVTDAIHMPRAKRAFTSAGFDVVVAPTRFLGRRPMDIASFIPKAAELECSSYAIHEWIGMIWYRIRYGFA